MSTPSCPKCGAKGDALVLVSQFGPPATVPGSTRRHAYRCTICGTNFMFSEPPPEEDNPPDWKPEELPER
jgi:rubredoxin